MINDSKLKLVFVSLTVGVFIGAISIYTIGYSSKDEVNKNYTLNNGDKLIKLENKITKLESYIQSGDVVPEDIDSSTDNALATDINANAIDRIGETLSNRLRTDLDVNKENNALEIKQEQQIAEQEVHNQDQLLRESVIASIQPDSLERMSNIREVMQSQQMMTMSKEGRERVVKELVQMANNGEIDIATFFNN